MRPVCAAFMGRSIRAALLMLAALPAPGQAAMLLGVNTHFEQGWPISALAKVQESGAHGIREAISWGKVERVPGQYAFTAANSGFLDRICAQNIAVLLDLPMRNARYDGGGPLVSASAQAAYGRFVRAVTDRFRCVTAVEIGNEVNAISRKYPGGPDKATDYVATVRAVRSALNGSDRPIALVGGSSLMVATGFLERLFAAGLLPLVDAIAVHPYVDVPELLPAQLARLRGAMTRAGTVKPIWATEFGLYYPTPDAAPRHGWKVLAILSAEGVTHAYWYALLDEPWFPNMGLYANGRPKPALQMFQRATRMLATQGDARRIPAGDPLTYVYRFGDGESLIWASDRALRLAPGTAVLDAQGQAIAPPGTIGPDPVLLAANARWDWGSVHVLADTQFDAGQSPWRATLISPQGKARALGWVDSNWASYIGLADMPNVTVSANLVSLPQGRQPHVLEESFASPMSGALWLSVCTLATQAARPDISIVQNGQAVGRIDAARPNATIRLMAKAGDSIALRYRKIGADTGAASVRRRIRILTMAEPGSALCPAKPSATR